MGKRHGASLAGKPRFQRSRLHVRWQPPLFVTLANDMADSLADSFVFDLEESQGSYDLEASADSGRSRGGGGGGGRSTGGPGQHASRRTAAADAQPGSDFWDRVQRGHNTTKIGSNTNPRDVASQIAAQARAAVDCPVLQCVGPQSTNQAMKAIAIARTYLKQSDAGGDSSHPDLTVYPEFVKLSSGDQRGGGGGGAGEELSAVQLAISKRSRRPSVDKEGRCLKVSTQTDAKSLAGAIASCTREGSRVELTAIGAGSVNQVQPTPP